LFSSIEAMISLKALMLGKPYHRTTTPKRSKSPSIFIEPGITRLSGPQIRGPTSCGTGRIRSLSCAGTKIALKLF